MKKILKLILIVLVIVILSSTIINVNSYATTNCKVELQTAKTQLKKGEEFNVNVYLSNIESVRGIIALSGVLEYDKDSLNLVKIEGKSNWETPTDGISYNTENGKIAINREKVTKENEIIFTMLFKVKDEAKVNSSIKLKNIMVADGNGVCKIDMIDKIFTIKKEEPLPDKEEIISTKYEIENTYIAKIAPNTTLSEFRKYVETNCELVLFDKNGTQVYETTKMATGMVLKVGNTLQYNIVVTGDIDGDGEVEVNDLARLKLHMIENINLTGIYLKAADTDYNNEIDANDLAKIKLKMIGLGTID